MVSSYMDQMLSGNTGDWDALVEDIKVTRPGKELRRKLATAISALGNAANNLKFKESTGISYVVTFDEDTGVLTVR